MACSRTNFAFTLCALVSRSSTYASSLSTLQAVARSGIKLYLTAFPVYERVFIFYVSTSVAAVSDKRCLRSFPFSCSDTGTGKEGVRGLTWGYRLPDLLIDPPFPVTSCAFLYPFFTHTFTGLVSSSVILQSGLLTRSSVNPGL